mmetsp:Transcript_146141/g.466999  ORF Transcript_146141/g.466999 Transcript_146141/m.466999 type:complete len:123 (-) Transcript_146141:279-647(-)
MVKTAKPAKPESSGLAIGLNKGFIVTRREMAPKPSHMKGRNSKRNMLVKEVIREVVGYAPYERRMLELIKIGSASTFKRSLKLAKRYAKGFVDAFNNVKDKSEISDGLRPRDHLREGLLQNV